MSRRGNNVGTMNWPWAGARMTGRMVVLAGVLWAGSASAQISPGELSAPHVDLEGSSGCMQCHQARKGVDADLCLSCHKLLAERLSAGKGLHAAEDYRQCESCHIEHHGRDFELVWWGEEGIDSFDHLEAGYALEGAHAKVECGKCHTAANIPDPEPLLKRGKDLSRTFLGLETGCLTCHDDSHRGQVTADRCTDCHTMTAWKPASLFDHDRTVYPLTGSHRSLECSKCHATLVDGATAERESYLQFKVEAFQQCVDCHKDPHESRLGSSCTECHSTERWRSVDSSRFDHAKTRFQLLGKHRGVECRNCHPQGRSPKVEEFEVCTDCHADVHVAQFNERKPGGSACEACHTVDGFSPSTFTVEQHQKSEYPLAGAHLAIPCFECHVPTDASALAREMGVAPSNVRTAPLETALFYFESTRCLSCHSDPHLGEVDRFVKQEGCETCHAVESWRLIEFDHGLTEYRLEAAHAKATCEKCHEMVEAEDENGATRTRMRMVGAPRLCAGCHRDPHLGQFDRPDTVTECASCHVVKGWKETTFDHDRDSSYRLEGAHSRVACAGCHRAEQVGEEAVVRYKPLPTDCASCHGSAVDPTG